jgi:hypothetical protein
VDPGRGFVKRFAFLTCVRDPTRYERLRRSILGLVCPQGVEIGLFTEREERNLAAAYNRLQEAAAEWRYKAYVHDDVVILNPALVRDALRIFKNRRIALLGIAGCRYLPESCVWWNGSGVMGKVVHLAGERQETLQFEEPAGEFERVEAVDGVCMITQHDLPWDGEIPGFHFYDVSQSTRYLLAGYDVVVPRQAEPWIAHEHRGHVLSDAYALSQAAFRQRYDAERACFARARARRRLRRLAARVRRQRRLPQSPRDGV